ncbi:MAG TPA: hypothetical protein VM715_00555 [Candidatus Acidoferrum sp.]|jgi:hypothetical protein|nr:hypothetical protein [Candidatus Acidoferrum sp.]
MPRYFFDVTDTRDSSRDSEGVEFPSLKAARAEALRTLGEIAKHELPDGDRRNFVIRIREKSGPPILSATLTLRVETHEPNSTEPPPKLAASFSTESVR